MQFHTFLINSKHVHSYLFFVNLFYSKVFNYISIPLLMPLSHCFQLEIQVPQSIYLYVILIAHSNNHKLKLLLLLFYNDFHSNNFKPWNNWSIFFLSCCVPNWKLYIISCKGVMLNTYRYFRLLIDIQKTKLFLTSYLFKMVVFPTPLSPSKITILVRQEYFYLKSLLDKYN